MNQEAENETHEYVPCFYFAFVAINRTGVLNSTEENHTYHKNICMYIIDAVLPQQIVPLHIILRRNVHVSCLTITGSHNFMFNFSCRPATLQIAN